MIRNALLFLIVIAVGTLSAQETKRDTTTTSSDSLHRLDDMVVTATRTEKRISETPANISVVSEKEISTAPAKSIDDMIKTEQGVQVKRATGIGEGIPSDIIIRGVPGALAATRTLVLVDGIPTNVSGTPFLLLNEIPLHSVKSVEVLRGPHSALYGANAFGGVINIITKNFEKKFEGTGIFETTYPFAVGVALKKNSFGESLKKGGSYGFWDFEGVGGGTVGDFSYMVSAGYRTIGNYLLSDSALVRTGNKLEYRPTENYDYRDIRLFAKMGYYFTDDLYLQVNTRYFNSDLGFGKTFYLDTDPSDDIDENKEVITTGNKILVGPYLTYYPNDNIELSLGGYGRQLIGEFYSEEQGKDSTFYNSYWRSVSRDFQLDGKGLFNIGNYNILSVGFDILTTNISFGDKGIVGTDKTVPGSFSVDESVYNLGVYAQDEFSYFDKKLNIVPAARLDYHKTHGMAFSPKLGLSYSFNDLLRARASVGKAFRAPALTELYMPDLFLTSGIPLRANPELKPETLWAFDLGGDFTPLKNLRFSLGGFYNQMYGLVTQESSFEEGKLLPEYITHRNTDKAKSRGLEFSAEYRNSYIALFGNLTLQQTHNLFYDKWLDFIRKFVDTPTGYDDISYVSLSYVPNTMGNVGVRGFYTIGKIDLSGSLTANIVGKRHFVDITSDPIILPSADNPAFFDYIELPSYTTVDLSLKVELHKKYALMFSIQNMFDKVYEESDGTNAPGRMASLKVTISK